MECNSATKSWKTFCIWLAFQGSVAIVVSIQCISLARRQLAARSRNNNTSSSQLLYHPGPLLFANGFLVLSFICSTLSGEPDVHYENMNFETWLYVTKALKMAALGTYITGSVLTIYGSVRLFIWKSTCIEHTQDGERIEPGEGTDERSVNGLNWHQGVLWHSGRTSRNEGRGHWKSRSWRHHRR